MSSQNGSVKAHRRLTPSTARRLAWIAIVVVAWVAHRHVVQKPILFNDDFILLGSAYTLPRFWAELFVPHNGHLCPLARTVSQIASHCTPSFSAIVYVLIVIKIAFFAYAVWSLTALMRAMRFGWRARALAAAVFAGTGSFASAVDWYSASFGLLAAALALHSGALTLRYLRNGRPVHLVLAVTSAVLATASYGSGAVAGLIALAAAVTAGRPGFRRVLAGGLPLIAIGVTVLVLRFLAPARDDLLTTDLGLVAGAVFQKIGALVLQHNLRLVGATGLGWTIGVLAALLTAAVWSLSDRVGRRAVMLAGVALFGTHFPRNARDRFRLPKRRGRIAWRHRPRGSGSRTRDA